MPHVTEVEKNQASLATQWLLNSGIQDLTSKKRFRGGVHAWFDQDKKNYSFLYSEITGYAINCFLFFRDLLNNDRFLVKAKEAARWLTEESYQKNMGVQTRIGGDELQENYFKSLTFTFDNWIVVYGLCNLYHVTKDAAYLEKALAIAQFLISKVRMDNGMFYPVFNIRTDQPEAPNDKWSRQSGSFHAKGLFALLKLYELTGDKIWFKTASQLADAVLKTQQPDGRFVTHDASQSTLLHPHLYTLEGLAYFGLNQNDEAYIDSAEKGLRWILKAQNPDGSIYCFFEHGRFRPYVRIDILAQTLRLGSILMLSRKDSEFNHGLEKLRTCLINHQITAGEQRGGFLYGQEENGSLHNHVNAWVSMFAAQALWLYDYYLPEGKPYLFQYFV